MTITKGGALPRGLLLASTALAGVFASGSAFAACNPAAAFNVTATCTGTTLNQNGTTGYGGFFQNFNVTVQPGATVTGSNDGLEVGLNSSITNAGTITGTTQIGARFSGSSPLINSGTITGATLGVLGGNLTVTNSGTISGTEGIVASTLNLVNSGTVAGTTNVAVDVPTATINNSGTITSPFVAVNAPTLANITNSGTMTSGFRTILIGNGTVNNSGLISVTGANTNLAIFNITGNLAVTNSGTITSSGTGVAGIAATSVINSGTIVAVGNPIFSQGALTATNSGTIRTNGIFTDAIYANTTANLTNSGLIEALDAGGYALLAAGSATVNNSGTMIGGGIGIYGNSVTLTNSGTVRSRDGYGVYSSNAFNVTNSGVISGQIVGIGTNGFGGTLVNSGTIIGETSDGINHAQTLNLTNSGVISGGRFGAGAMNAANTIIATNSGTIFGTNTGLRANASGNVTNSGTIAGGSGTAIQFGATGGPASDTLTVLYGARFGGLVDFGFGADTVNFAKGNWVLDIAKFNAGASTVNTQGNPYFVTPNQIVVVDNSNFAAMNRAIMDITGWISSVLPDTPRPVAGAFGATPPAFAPVDSLQARFEDVFDAFPRDALGYAKAPVFKAGAANYADGSSIWAKGFGGRREQTGSAAIFGNTTTGYGGAIGYERTVAPNVRLGALAGASTNRTEIAANQGSTDTDVFFGGLYARYMPGATFLDLAVIGGMLDNSSARNVFGALAVQTARADYDGWFVNPQATLGHAFTLDANGATTLTPAVKVRYVGAHFDGYAETGSVANLAVGARDVHAFEERGQLTFAAVRDFGSWSRIAMHMTGGVLAQQRSGGATVSLGLFGQNILAATPDKANTAGVFGSTGFDWQIGNLMVFSAAEFTATDDSNRTMSAKGGVRYVW